ncbi:MAG: SUMF1/EgtB/PvdO family nonheme iron enzyme [Sedimentisphaerales bacterium]|nr:SUMF1/EgtB/PvdO family nonheme iron enzyme [Sedimentisphaerales bacterium]
MSNINNGLIKQILFLLMILIFLVSACRRTDDPTTELQAIKTKTGIEMIKIPEGWFNMGSSDSPDESPVHKVWVDSFWMDSCEVVQTQFKKFQISDPSHFKDPNNPLEQINWTDAAMFCNERSLAEGLEPCYNEETWQCNFDVDGYRLPTEAEWEYACRAGTTTKFSFGNNLKNLKDHAWFAGNSSGKTHLVGQKNPNPWGLYDMHGNVSEWCNDYYSDSYYKNSEQKNPRGPAKGEERVLRGGAWNSGPDSCRSSYRTSDPSIDDTCLASDAIGFRCVRNASDNKSPEKNMAKNEPNRKMSKTGFVYDDVYLKHRTTPGHPETSERLVAITKRLKTTGLYPQLHKISPRPVASEWLEMVHSSEYIRHVKESCQSNAGYLDSMDVPISKESYEAALVAAGGVLSAIDAVMEGKVKNAFCAVRPPGHHALKDKAMGFCIFNNVAIGAKYIQNKHNLSDILIVDWDVHHGNGTQAMFYDDPSILYFSTHRYPFYPGTGSEAENGSGKGINRTINVPMPIGSGDNDYLRAFKEKLEPAALAFSPDFILISAGFDAHKDDLLGGMKVTAQGFAQLTQIVKDISEKCCDGRLVSVLEGGYGLEGLADSVEAHIKVLMK